MVDSADDEKSTDESGDRPKLSDMMKGLAMGGLATYFMTEDAIKGYLKEMKLPKELASALLDGASKKKDDLYGLMVKEFGKVLSKVDVSQEVSKFLERHHISVEARVSFEPKTKEPTSKEDAKTPKPEET